MKKQIFIWLLCAVLMISAGCSGEHTPPTETTPEPSTAQTTIPETTEATQPAEDPILTQRRETVLAYMRQMQTVLWTPDEDITYTDQANFGNGARTLTYKAGTLYRGVPYTHGSGSGDAFMDYALYQDDRGVWHISGLGTEDLSGNHNNDSAFYPRIGNDCADALFWAWAQVSASISFRGTTTMTQAYGCVKVGEYECDLKSHTSTKEFCQKNGMPVMYAAYAQLKPGDGVVCGKDGHAMMVSEVNVVYKEDGSVDGNRSSIKTVHQTSEYSFGKKTIVDKDLSAVVYYCGGVDDTFAFWKLFSTGYIPVTCAELIDPSPLSEPEVEMSNKNPSLDTMFQGTVTSNYRISDVTVTITDAAGKVVQQSTCYGREVEMYAFQLERFTWEEEQPGLRGILDPETLDAGTYTVTYVCRVAGAEPITIGTFTFEK